MLHGAEIFVERTQERGSRGEVHARHLLHPVECRLVLRHGDNQGIDTSLLFGGRVRVVPVLQPRGDIVGIRQHAIQFVRCLYRFGMRGLNRERMVEIAVDALDPGCNCRQLPLGLG